MKFFSKTWQSSFILTFLLLVSGNSQAEVIFTNEGVLAKSLAIVKQNEGGLWYIVRENPKAIVSDGSQSYSIDEFNKEDNEYIAVCDSFTRRIIIVLQSELEDEANYLLDEGLHGSAVVSKADDGTLLSCSKISQSQQLKNRARRRGPGALLARTVEVFGPEDIGAMLNEVDGILKQA